MSQKNDRILHGETPFRLVALKETNIKGGVVLRLKVSDLSLRLLKSLLFLVLAFTLLTPGTAAQTVIKFWSSGYTPDMQQFVTEEVIPKFTEQTGIQVEYSDLTWGERTDKLTVAFAGGVGPDVLTNASLQDGLPLDDLIAKWPEKDMIDPALWAGVKDNRDGKSYNVPQFIDLRGLAYNKRLFGEAGLPDTPPDGWKELKEYAKKLTRLEGNSVAVSGFETTWASPYVDTEYDWFVQQAGKSLVSDDLRTSQINSDEGLEGLRAMVELYGISHPVGYTSVNEWAFPKGQVAITRGGVWVLRSMQESMPEDVPMIGLFAPRRGSEDSPVAQAHIQKLGISKETKSPEAAWQFLAYLMSAEVQTGFAPLTDRLIVRRDVFASSRVEAVRLSYPWYVLMQHAVVPNFFPGGNNVAPVIAEALEQKVSPLEAIERMDHLAQVALDEYWSK